jgi:succinate dehydrogenase (ubiquinone) cytochrome b560 subunit
MHYAWPVAAISSITNRVTGGALTVGLSGMGVLSLVGADVGAIMSSVGSSGVGPLAKFTVAFPLVYHYMGGVRHLVWDFYPDTVNNDQCATSSYALGGAAILLSTGLAFTSF